MDNQTTIDKLSARVAALEKQLGEVKMPRITQDMIIPGTVKQRHISEGVIFIRGGVVGNKPSQGENGLQGVAVYYDVTNKILYIWNTTNKAWDHVQFT